MKNILSTVVHEVGHTLGLRHNFIAQEDGNTSSMCYSDDLDTTSYLNKDSNIDHGAKKAKYGGHFVYKPGKYDIYAIKYGYTPLKNECSHVRHPALDLLANGQNHDDVLNNSVQLNPLFATDEDMNGEDPRVNTWNYNVRGCGYDKLYHSLSVRQSLLLLVQNNKIFPELYAERVRFSLASYTRHVADALKLLGGRQQDATRKKMIMTSSKDSRKAIGALVDFCVGDGFRFNEEEINYMRSQWPSSSYYLSTGNPTDNHVRFCHRLIDQLLSPATLTRLEIQYNLTARSKTTVSDGSQRLRTLDVLRLLAYEDGKHVKGGLFSPFKAVLSYDEGSEKDDFINLVNDNGNDILYSTASMHLAIVANERMHSTAVHASVRAGAAAFVLEISVTIRTWLEMYDGTLNPIARAHWVSIVEALTKPPNPKTKAGGMGNFLQLMLGKKSKKTEPNQIFDEDNVFDDFLYLGCNQMRCLHDPYRTSKARHARTIQQRRDDLLRELKNTVIMGHL